MAEPEKLSEGVWRIRWTDAAGKRKSHQPFATRKAALAYGADKEREAPGLSSGMTWGEWRHKWVILRGAAQSTAYNDVGRIDKWLVPQWGPMKLVDIERIDVKLWLAELDGQMADGSIIKLRNILVTSLNAALEANLISANPAAHIPLDDETVGRERFFTRDEIAAALEQLNNPYSNYALGLVETGMRFSELAALHWEKINLDTKTITIDWAVSCGQTEPTKGRNRRGVPLSNRLLAVIGDPSSATSCGQIHSRKAGPCRSGLVIPAPQGGWMNARNMLQRHWYPALEAAGIAPGRQHDLRHTYASWMVQDGMSLDRLAELLGHSSSTVTKRYAHLAGKHIEEAREILDRVRAEEVSPSRPLSRKFKIIPGGL